MIRDEYDLDDLNVPRVRRMETSEEASDRLWRAYILSPPEERYEALLRFRSGERHMIEPRDRRVSVKAEIMCRQLSEDQIDWVRVHFHRGWSTRQMAFRLDVSEASVDRVVQRIVSSECSSDSVCSVGM
ncbi:hypothetical protein KOR42_23600 [Thalassoglobus neptunius]|uniref:Uncharacterized protein n=1 Tax=Thalassoglobus neptunius TaxID=1938619 RepID=A0A5C5X9I1_9PLAN|nr:hypothetical protein KOR42_23600 [Thalassoglobus neptunius]